MFYPKDKELLKKEGGIPRVTMQELWIYLHIVFDVKITLLEYEHFWLICIHNSERSKGGGKNKRKLPKRITRKYIYRSKKQQKKKLEIIL
jgi:hypothetical protein